LLENHVELSRYAQVFRTVHRNGVSESEIKKEPLTSMFTLEKFIWDEIDCSIHGLSKDDDKIREKIGVMS